MKIRTKFPRWTKPFFKPERYKGVKGGRGSGKSHFVAEKLVLEMAADPELSVVCIREIQKSLKFSAKRLIETKIEALGLAALFEITLSEIRARGGNGVMIFQGMQDHTADSIKSLEGFDRAWVEEAQNLSRRSMELLLPTIRTPGSELYFTWNPDQETDPVEKLFESDGLCVHVNFTENPFCPEEIKKEAERHRQRSPETYDHVWLGGYNTLSDDQVLCGKYIIQEFEPEMSWDGPYFGADWGFSVDPTVLVSCYIHDESLHIFQESYGEGVEIIDTPELFDKVDDASLHVIRADSARPELVSYMQKNRYPKTISVDKWKGSVEDGITVLRSFKCIIIHPRCIHTAEEARLWKYKRDRLTGDVLPILIDANNHCWDAIRYALAPIIQQGDNLGQLLDMAMGTS